jgi:predicted amidohydrolase YtcJ
MPSRPSLLRSILSLTLFLSVLSLAGEEPKTIFFNARIYTFDAQGTRAEALAVRDGRVVAVGTDTDILALAGPGTARWNLRGRTVLPGLIDAHGHLPWLGQVVLNQVDLLNTHSRGDAIALVVQQARTLRPGEWILGARWDQANWGLKELPTHDDLSAATPDHPVLLTRIDGHCVLINRAAMKAAGITRATKSPPGGEVLKDAQGEPTGILIDAARRLVRPVMRAGNAGPTDELLAAQEACLSVGLTGVHDAGLSLRQVELYRQLCETKRWKLRVYGMLNAGAAASWCPTHPPEVGLAEGRFSLRAVKCGMDGALGSRGAWLIEPYADRPDSRGVPTNTPEGLAGVCQLALEHGYQVCTHAIGDRANRETLNVYEKVLRTKPGLDARWRIEHAQVIALEDLPRFARLKVIPSMQFTHATSDMRWAEDRVGPDRLKGAYAWATLLTQENHIAAGSDFPVESENPLWGVYAAITRQDREGTPDGGWRPEERITREQAFRAFTLDAAWAAFEERDKGSLEPGKLADFVVFDRDVMTCQPKELLHARVRSTVIGGLSAYEVPE